MNKVEVRRKCLILYEYRLGRKKVWMRIAERFGSKAKSIVVSGKRS